MFITGNLQDETGAVRKVSGLPALQFSGLARVDDVEKCTSLRPGRDGDIIYLVGPTRDELGCSEYYQYRGETGVRVPKVSPDESRRHYEAVHRGIMEELFVSVHGLYRGGLAVALAETALAGELGMTVDLARVPVEEPLREDKLLYSETPSRFLLTCDPADAERVGELLSAVRAAKIGGIGGERVKISDLSGKAMIDLPLERLEGAYYGTFSGF